MGIDEGLLRRQPEGLQRPDPAVGVKSTPNGIGYVSLFFTNGVHTIPYKGVACNLRNAKSGQYGGVRNFYMVTRGAPDGRGEEVDQLDHPQQRGQPRSSPPSGFRCN